MRINSLCSGTVSFCTSVNATTLATFNTFLNTFLPTLYLPINQYDPAKQEIYGSSVFPQVLREGTSNFNTTFAVEETLLVDQIQLLDDRSKSIMRKPPFVLQQSISSDKFLNNEYSRSVFNATGYYECRIRPSGNVKRVFLITYNIDYLIGIMYGCLFLFFAVLHCFGKCYNNFNARARLAY